MNKKGFTLIELLAVIVILAIIALITVPTVLGIIDKAKKGAAEDSTYGVIDAAKLAWSLQQLEGTVSEITYTYTDSVCTATDGTNSVAALVVEGTKPVSGTVVVNADGVAVTDLVVNGYTCNKTAAQSSVTCTAN